LSFAAFLLKSIDWQIGDQGRQDIQNLPGDIWAFTRQQAV
tara:strand:+ start:792 stop:911 length:120 start_codon:yes stop_codon:yes gene_type:complete